MLKKLFVLGVLLLVASWAVSATDVGSYVKTFLHDAFAKAKKNVPIDFEIRVAEDELAKLDQVDDRLISAIASEMVAVEKRQRELDEAQTNLAKKKDDIRARYAALKLDKTTLFINDQPVSRDLFTLELDKACKNFKAAEGIVDNYKKMLADHQSRLAQAKESRDALKSQKIALDERIQKLKTDLEVLKAAEMRSKRGCCDGQVAELERLKNRIDSLEGRIQQRRIEMELREEQPKATPSARSSVEITQEAERILAGDSEKK